MAATAAKVGPGSADAADFKAKAHADLDAKVVAGSLKPSPSVDKLKNFDWELAHATAQVDPTSKPAAPKAPDYSSIPKTKWSDEPHPSMISNVTGDTSIKGYTRWESPTKAAEYGSLMNQAKLTPAQKSALADYKGSDYKPMNAALRDGGHMNAGVLRQVVNMDTATHAGTLPSDTVLYRSVADYTTMGVKNPLSDWKPSPGYLDNGFMSASVSKAFASGWSSGSSKHVMFELKAKKGANAVHVGAGEGFVGKPVVPGGAVGDQRIPSLRAPALRDAAPLDHKMGQAARPQVTAHRHARLTAADNQRSDARAPGSPGTL